MIIKHIIFTAVFIFTTFACSEKQKDQPSHSPPYVILKLDDLWFEDGLVHKGWIQVVDFLNKEKVKGTIGIIGSSLETDDKGYLNWVKTRHQEGYEIWHHGFCHCESIKDEKQIREYRGEGLEEQCISIEKTQFLAKQKLGITLRSFGAVSYTHLTLPTTPYV